MLIANLSIQKFVPINRENEKSYWLPPVPTGRRRRKNKNQITDRNPPTVSHRQRQQIVTVSKQSNDSNRSNNPSNKAATSRQQIIHSIYCIGSFTMTHSSKNMFSFCLLLAVVVAALVCLLAEPTIASSSHRMDEDGASSSSSTINSRFHALRERAMNNPTIPEKIRGKTLSDFVVANENNENKNQKPQRQQQKRRRQNNNSKNRQAQEQDIEFQNAASSPSTNFFAVSLSLCLSIFVVQVFTVPKLYLFSG